MQEKKIFENCSEVQVRNSDELTTTFTIEVGAKGSEYALKERNLKPFPDRCWYAGQYNKLTYGITEQSSLALQESR